MGKPGANTLCLCGDRMRCMVSALQVRVYQFNESAKRINCVMFESVGSRSNNEGLILQVGDSCGCFIPQHMEHAVNTVLFVSAVVLGDQQIHRCTIKLSHRRLQSLYLQCMMHVAALEDYGLWCCQELYTCD